jgi:hypothetical protein
MGSLKMRPSELHSGSVTLPLDNGLSIRTAETQAEDLHPQGKVEQLR